MAKCLAIGVFLIAACSANADAPETMSSPDLPSLDLIQGTYTCDVFCPAGDEGETASVEVVDDQITFINEAGMRSPGVRNSDGSFTATSWSVTCTISSDGNEILWSNGTIWSKTEDSMGLDGSPFE